MEAALPVAEAVASAAESTSAASTVDSSSDALASSISSPSVSPPSSSSSISSPILSDEAFRNIPNIPIQNPTSSTIPSRFSDNTSVAPPASQRGTTFVTDTSKPPPTIPRGTTFGPSTSTGSSSSSTPMSGIKSYFNQTAQSNTNSSNEAGKSSSANGLLSNLLLGPRFALNPTINIGNSSQNQHTISNAGSPHP
nr:MAG: hypothetical protein 1 [Myotis brandtii picorna-like virus 1]